MASSSTTHGKRILIAEDEAIISVILSGDLRDEGYVIAGPFSTAREAIASLKDETPDVAIVDYMLRDGPCTTLLQRLRARGVPFVIFSGYARGPENDDEFSDVPWFEKPASSDALLEVLASLSAPRKAKTETEQ
jgi:DNA-binding NtrC family response regulator